MTYKKNILKIIYKKNVIILPCYFTNTGMKALQRFTVETWRARKFTCVTFLGKFSLWEKNEALIIINLKI